MQTIHDFFKQGFEEALRARPDQQRRIGAELKFPLVQPDGSAARLETVVALWEYLCRRGWEPITDGLTGSLMGARRAGPQNDTVSSCETGYCKTEFSLAHVGDLHELATAVRDLREELRPFSEEHEVSFLGYGIQPLTPPSQGLLMKRGRTSVWDRVFGANRVLSPDEGDDVNLFTVNACSHVHVSVAPEEAIPAVNVLNGFAGAQIALTAHSNIWKGRPDPEYKCVNEKLWDWWMPDAERVGVPRRPFRDLGDYIAAVAEFKPVYVEREGRPVLLTPYETFAEYYQCAVAQGCDLEGQDLILTPAEDDIALHATCYWHTARLTRYYTVENRANDQQPPEELLTIAALTLGLVSALPEAQEELSAYRWEDLSEGREAACRRGLQGRAGPHELAELAGRMLEVARRGLRRRGRAEEEYLAPLEARLQVGRCPADEARRLFASGGVAELVRTLAFT